MSKKFRQIGGNNAVALMMPIPIPNITTIPVDVNTGKPVYAYRFSQLQAVLLFCKHTEFKALFTIMSSNSTPIPANVIELFFACQALVDSAPHHVMTALNDYLSKLDQSIVDAMMSYRYAIYQQMKRPDCPPAILSAIKRIVPISRRLSDGADGNGLPATRLF